MLRQLIHLQKLELTFSTETTRLETCSTVWSRIYKNSAWNGSDKKNISEEVNDTCLNQVSSIYVARRKGNNAFSNWQALREKIRAPMVHVKSMVRFQIYNKEDNFHGSILLHLNRFMIPFCTFLTSLSLLWTLILGRLQNKHNSCEEIYVLSMEA